MQLSRGAPPIREARRGVSTVAPGWYLLPELPALAPGESRPCQLFAREAVLFRGDGGTLHLLDAHCPHLGANLNFGGRVEGDRLVCPFHGWRFDGDDGSLVSVPGLRGKLPKACTRAWPVRERDGRLWVWQHPEGHDPDGPPPPPEQAPVPGPEDVDDERRLPLPPFPTGWYALCFSEELGARPLALTWCGRELSLSRAGGRVRARARDGGPDRPVVEQQDAVFAWFDAAGRPPQWQLPELDELGWSGYAGHCWRGLASHPQETSENSVDVAHFSVVHGYEQVRTRSPATREGPVLRARYGFERRLAPKLSPWPTLRIEFEVRAFGLGYSLVETQIPALDLELRQLVFATPTDGERVDLRIAVAAREPRLPKLPRRLITELVQRFLLRSYIDDVSADLEIWEHKRYVHPPRLSAVDGPIGVYRRWARQFDPADEVGRESAGAT